MSWLGRAHERRELDGVTVFVGRGDAVFAFPEPGADLAGAVGLARAAGAREVGCWALEPDDELGDRLTSLGFQDGWQPHWMGIDPRELREPPAHPVEESSECSRELPYAHERAEDLRHLVVREGATLVGHTALNVDGDSADLVRVEGELSKRPSFWTRRVRIVREYARIDGMHVPVAMRSTADVLIVGASSFAMTYRYTEINGHSVDGEKPVVDEVKISEP